MKKTMVFENETAYDNWFDVNEEKEGGHDFLENRVVIVKGTRTINIVKGKGTIQSRNFNGFSADSTIECKNVRTAVRRFVKELNSNGFEVSVDEFEGSCNGENLHDLTGSGMVVEVEEIDDGVFYVNYMCYQNEVEEEATETETTEPETDEFNLTPEQTEKLISDYEDFIRQMESLKEKEEPETATEEQATEEISGKPKTRKELIAACVDDQIKRGVIKAENREMQIKARLNGKGYVKAMSKAECERWYDSVFEQKIDPETEEKRVCPICGRTYTEIPAISREDNTTEICPDCGTNQAIEIFSKIFTKYICKQEEQETEEKWRIL